MTAAIYSYAASLDGRRMPAPLCAAMDRPDRRDVIIHVQPASPGLREHRAQPLVLRPQAARADGERRSNPGDNAAAGPSTRPGARATIPRRLPWDDPDATTPPAILLYSSQFAAQQLAQEAVPEETADGPLHRHAAIAAYRRQLPEDVAVIGPAAATGQMI